MSKSRSAKALFSVLQSHDAASLPKVEQVIEIDSKMKPIDAANVLWEHGILGAPVWNEATHSYCGFFDMRDILSAVVAASTLMDVYGYNIAMVKQIGEIAEKETKKGMEVPCTLTYLASRNPVFSCRPDASLEKICNILSERKCRRVLLSSQEKGAHCDGMLSRSAIMKFLSKHASQEDLKETVSEAGLTYDKEVVTVNENATAREAFELMDSKGLYGLAVVDEEGTLVANTSASDIVLAALDKGKAAMDMDILSYLAAVRQSRTVAKGGKASYPASHVREDTTVGHVLNLLVKTGYHRVFVVNSHLQPVGVISQQDILRFIVENGQ